MFRAPLACALFLVCAVTITAQPKADDPMIGPKKLSEWKKELTDPNPTKRSTALFRLRAHRAKARPALPIVVGLLEDKDARVRSTAVSSLYSIGVSAEDLPLIAPLLNSEDRNVRSAAVSVLSLIDRLPRITIPKEALAPLTKAVKSPETSVQQSATRLLVKAGDSGKEAIDAALKDKNPKVRANVLRALGSAPNKLSYLDRFAAALNGPDQAVRVAAITALRSLGPLAEKTLPALRKALRDESPTIRTQAILTIGAMGPKAKDAAPDLLAVGATSSGRIRQSVLNTMRFLGASALPAVKELLLEGNVPDQLFALEVVAQMQASAQGAAPDIEKLMASTKSAKVRTACAAALWVAKGPSEELLAYLAKQPDFSFAKLGTQGAVLLGQMVTRESKQTKLAALTALRSSGAFASGAFPQVLALLDHEDKEIRAEASRTMIGLAPYSIARISTEYVKNDPKTVRLTGALLRRLNVRYSPAARGASQVVQKRATEHDDWIVRIDAAYLHWMFTQQSAVLLDNIAKAMDQDDPAVRAVAMRSLLSGGVIVGFPGRVFPRPGVPPQQNLAKDRERIAELLAKGRKDKDLAVRIFASHGSISRIGEPKIEDQTGLAMTFAEGLKSADPLVRSVALRGLGILGKDAGDVAKPVAGLLEDGDPEVRRWAVSTLLRLNPEGAVEKLTRAVNDPDETTSQLALQALSKAGKNADIVPALAKALGSPNRNARLQAAEALGKVGPAAASAVPELIQLLETEPISALTNPRIVLPGGTRFGPPALAPVVPTGSHPADKLLEPQEFAEPYRVVATALGRIGPKAKSAIPALKKRMGEAPSVTIAVLGDLGPEGASVLLESLGDSNADVRFAVLDSLTRNGSASEDVVAKILDVVKGDDIAMSQQALFALARLGESAKPATKTLVELVGDKKQPSQSRQLAARALGEIGTKSDAGLAVLVEALGDTDSDLARWSAYALGRMGEDAKSALPKLKELTDSPNAHLRRAARLAVDRIDPK